MFVRAEVWQARAERKELASYLASLPYSHAERRRIEAYPSKFTDDAQFITAFIDEVGRDRETAKALEGGGPRRAVEDFLRRYPLTMENRGNDYFEIDTATWDRLISYAPHLIAVQFHPVILDSAIVSPFFLKFNPTVNAFEETPLHQALVSLRGEIRRFNESNTSEALGVVYKHSPRQRGYENGTVDVEPIKLGGLLHLYDRWINILELCIAIYRYLDGKPFVEPSLRSRSPVRGLGEKFDQEIPTANETLAFINFDPIL